MTQVTVVGAGPTGLTAAAALLAAGVDVSVVDAAPGPATTSRALGLQPRGAEVLNRIGALANLPNRGLAGWNLVVVADGQTLIHSRVGTSVSAEAQSGQLISQVDIEAALRDRLTWLGGTIEWNRRLAGIVSHEDHANLTFSDGTERIVEWVVGADGAHSTVRTAAGIGFRGAPLLERFLLADVHVDVGRARDTIYAWFDGARFLAAIPLPGADLWRLMAPEDEGGAELEGDDIAERLGQQLAAATGASIRAVQWASAFHIQRRIADRYRSGRLLLAGDAAHIHSPVGGQGMNTGMGDAENLAWKLALIVQGRADHRLLDSYEAERRPVAEGVLEMTSRATMLAFGHTMMATTLRDVVVAPLVRTRWVQRRATQAMSQLDVSYSRGPLGSVGRLSWPRGLVAGDRVPNRLCTRRDGTAVRLHDTLGPGWALIGTEALVDMARERLGDVASLRGGARGNAMLVRPDGHLGWRGSRPAAMSDWLDRLCGPRTSSARGGHGRRAGRDI